MTYEDFAQEWDSRDMITCRTSGSTGAPKEILLPKQEMVNSALRTIDFFGLTGDSLLYSCIAPDFIGGKMMLVRQRAAGCRFLWETPSNRPLDGYSGEPISLLSVVPSQVIHILDNIKDMPVIDAMLVGGSSIPESLRHRIEKSGLNAYESYGMTETASHIALRRIKSELEPFRTLGDITVTISDEALVIDIPGWQSVRTNDSARIVSPREFFIDGRLDNIMISGGRKINPERVEDILSRTITFPFIITSRPDEKWGERIIMIAEAEESERPFIENECRNMLVNYMRPKEIIFTKHLPRTPNGKPVRNFKN